MTRAGRSPVDGEVGLPGDLRGRLDRRFIGALLLMMGVLVLVSTAFWPPASG
jgi:hypothetical protein